MLQKWSGEKERQRGEEKNTRHTETRVIVKIHMIETYLKASLEH
jgi:hypothetical protein